MKTIFKSLKIYFLGGIFLGIIVMLVPLIIEKIFWSLSGSDTIYFTKRIFFSYLGFFIILIGIIVPWMRTISRSLELKRKNFIDGIATIIIAISSFVPLIILTILTILLIRNEKYRYKIFHCSVVIALFLLGIKIKFHGELNKEAGEFAFNHTSPADYGLAPFAVGVEPWNILAGINLKNNKKTLGDRIISWILGYIIEKYSISIDRTSKASRFSAFRKMYNEMKNGKNIVIFPEGGRLTKDEIRNGKILGDFQDGAFALAWKEKISIQLIVLDWPVIYRGKDDEWWGVRPCTIHIRYSITIKPEDYTSMEDFKNACFQAMEDELRKSKNVQRFLKELAQQDNRVKN